ncbi:MAG: metal ABC transporter permease [Clostridiales bacterium]|uniref:Metal ABC transporter permease n=1 Tax=Candidatus Egerieisoma faecipullorum TaxID=2840963 RepID=A0A9D1I8S5_9CLOT|nr:metal ABC transporter permease [Clostridiales bacterium]HIU29328.1 metal ABC transporter permease [Candidatus Egerieisoma faecipullorum]
MHEALDLLRQIFSLSFMVRALVVGVLVALCSSLLGVSLVLKRYSMIGDGLSHVGFGALAAAAAMNAAPLKVAIPVVVITAFLLLRVNENGKLKGDSAIALVSASALALGVLIVSVSASNIDLNSYMFGSIYAVSQSDMYLSIALSAGILILYLLFYNKIFAVTFDENFARATGAHASVYNMVMACLTAVTIVIGMRLVGSLLISSLILFPPLTAMRVCKTFRRVVVLSAVLGVACVTAGILLSFLLDVPASACIVLVNLAAYLLFSLAGWAASQSGKRKTMRSRRETNG